MNFKKALNSASFGVISVVLALPVVTLADSSGSSGSSDPCTMLDTFKTTAVKIGGTLVVIGWVIAGILYLTSVGSQEKMGTAKKAITAAIIGTVLIILSMAAYQLINGLLKAGGGGQQC